jgi:hypothetical protein
MVKSLSSNINIIMAQYIIEPMKTLKKWVKPFVKMKHLVNFEYVYCINYRNIDLNIDPNLIHIILYFYLKVFII